MINPHFAHLSPPRVVVGQLDSYRLVEIEWALRESGFGARAVFEAALKDFSVPPDTLRTARELPSNEVCAPQASLT